MAIKIQGILFDLGDTILDFGKVDVPDKFEAGAHLGYQYLTELGLALPSFATFHRRQLWAIRWNYFKSRFTGREFNTLDILGQLCLKMGHHLSDSQMLELAWRFYQPLSQQATVEEGARQLLEELTAQGMRLGIVSNTFVPGKILDRHLAEAHLLDLLPLRVYSCDVGYRKPSPDIFRLALERAKLQPRETMFVGDNPRADIDGANKAGMISVLKDSQGKHANSKIQPRHRVRSLSELREILRQYNG